MSDSRSPNYIDLFAGCGGISLGLRNAGWRGLFAVERNEFAFATFEHNLLGPETHFAWPKWLPVAHHDVQVLLRSRGQRLSALRGTVDLIVGGPPCQGFSTAGRRKSSDQRNALAHAYVRFVEAVQPRLLIFENVRGFTMPFSNGDSKEAYSTRILRRLRGLGYTDARGEVVDLSRYGVPQRRNRFLVVASREQLAEEIFEAIHRMRPAFLRERKLWSRNTAQRALSDLERRHGYIDSPDTTGFQAGFLGPSANNYQRHLRITSARLPDSHRFVNHTAQVGDVFERLLQQAPRGKCLRHDERAVFGLRKRSLTVLDAGEPAPTLTTIPDDLLHYSEPRVLTVRECARLQSFPDWFQFKGPYTTGGKKRTSATPRYTQVGNAVPPLFAELVGLAARTVLERS